MKVRAKKSLGQHFLTDLSIAQRIAAALVVDRAEGRTAGECIVARGGETTPAGPVDVLEVGPGTGVLTQYLLQRQDISLRTVELDHEAVNYLLANFPQTRGRLIEADFLHLRLENLFPGSFCIIGNFPYNISSQIFFKVLDYRDRVPQVVGMVQKEVAERIAELPGSRTYGILSVLLQAWYDIEYLFSVGPGAFRPAPKVNSAVIRLRRNTRTDLGCDESLFKAVVKTSFNQRRKTLRNSLRPLIQAKVERDLLRSAGLTINNIASDLNHGATQDELLASAGISESAITEAVARFVGDPVFDLRPERLSVEDFVALTNKLS